MLSDGSTVTADHKATNSKLRNFDGSYTQVIYKLQLEVNNGYKTQKM